MVGAVRCLNSLAEMQRPALVLWLISAVVLAVVTGEATGFAQPAATPPSPAAPGGAVRDPSRDGPALRGSVELLAVGSTIAMQVGGELSWTFSRIGVFAGAATGKAAGDPAVGYRIVDLGARLWLGSGFVDVRVGRLTQSANFGEGWPLAAVSAGAMVGHSEHLGVDLYGQLMRVDGATAVLGGIGLRIFP